MKRTVDDLIAIIRAVDNSDTSECGFDMTHTNTGRNCSEHPCGTACCIGGHANLAVYGPGYSNASYSYVAQTVATFGIALVEAEEICFPSNYPKAWCAKQEHAVRLLEIYRDEGVVSWERAMAETE